MDMEHEVFSKRFAPLLPPYRIGQAVQARPLARYLPEIPAGMISDCLTRAASGMVFDPFGLSPDLDLEIAQSGCTVLACVNNPVTRVLFELAAQPPTEAELNRCTSLLAHAMKGGQQLQAHIQSLYQTTCNSCGKTIQASGFLWEREASLPYAREYTCPFCWESGSYPLTEIDEQTLAPVQRVPLQRAWAIERIAPPGDALREDAVQVVDSHLARPLYVIFSLINRLETLSLTGREKLIMNGLLLNVLDDATPMQQLEHIIQRPRQLVVPAKFREHNLWNSFERALDFWRTPQKRVRFTCYPDLPDGAGICLYQGRVKELFELHTTPPMEQAITVPPRPNQAFWTLSAVWASWLMGRPQAAAMAQVIARRRYDWNWHTSALGGTLRFTRQMLKDDAVLTALIPEVEPAFLSTIFQAMNQAGFSCSGLAIRPEDELAQSTWRVASNGPADKNSNPGEVVRGVCRDYLLEKAEPADYLEMTAAACLGVDHEKAWPVEQTQVPLLQQMRASFSNPAVFSHYGPGEQTLESGLWSLRNFMPGVESLTDRVEEQVIRILASGYPVTPLEVERRIREELRPIFTPLREYIRHILESYGEEDQSGSGRWLVRVHEHPALRDSDMKTICGMTDTLGRRLGFHIRQHENCVDWLEGEGGVVRYEFHIISHTRISSILSAPAQNTAIRSVVLPGSRANLLTYKLKNNPLLQEQMNEGWHVVKFRHIYRLAENPMLTTDSLQLWLDSDPPEYKPLQMDLF
jgi:hypothetical protein